MGTPALEIKDLNAWYGESHVLHGINLSVNKGEVVCLLGRNGAGRTTTLRSVLGLVSSRTGSIKVNGLDVLGMPTHEVARLGIGYCPEERGIFTSLTCEQNLMLPPKVGDGMAMEVVRTLKERGFTIILVEQNFRFASKLADRNYVIEHGQVVKVVERSELGANEEQLRVLLGV